ncbi:hypothetical protein [Tengunoibacter tsumagoiensis]|uniref:Uncharacterized protein n=1 Tax=Tengunoibacter tsumagoiensis TaxID=2014871 RepID=A0A402A2M9_9CHLR|nr:hypothetical protein [Tengunoibacter tsumagoiensis]GCE13384.1 hypothetical protein KTT_32430 [Tengunoibacter tsumagoiensis]
MEKPLSTAGLQDTVVHGIHLVGTFFSRLEKLLRWVSRLILRVTGLLICVGGVLSTVGWLLAAVHTDPLSPTWSVAVWLVISGVIFLVFGFLALYAQYMLRIGSVGQFGLLVFLLGALVLIAGTCAVDLFILPWLFKVVSQLPDLAPQLQGMYNTVQNGTNTAASTVINGTNTATSTVTNGTTSACNTVTQNLPFGGSSLSCPSASSPTVPSGSVPSVTVPTISSLLASIGLPPLPLLGTLGLMLMSGALLAPGCLLLGLIFLVADVRPRSALLLMICCALLNLLGQFFLHIPFLGQLSGVILFISLAWLGFALWAPGKLKLPGSLAVQTHSTTAS